MPQTETPEPTRWTTAAIVVTVLFVALVLMLMAVAMKRWVIDGTP
jgi:hypothetical protein